MSEYMERHSVSKLIVLLLCRTRRRRTWTRYVASEIEKHPNCVLLLDEVEKAQFEVLQVLLQVMDDGRLTGSTGKTVVQQCCIDDK